MHGHMNVKFLKFVFLYIQSILYVKLQQDISHTLQNSNAHYPIHESLPQIPVLNQTNPVHTLLS